MKAEKSTVHKAKRQIKKASLLTLISRHCAFMIGSLPVISFINGMTLQQAADILPSRKSQMKLHCSSSTLVMELRHLFRQTSQDFIEMEKVAA